MLDSLGVATTRFVAVTRASRGGRVRELHDTRVAIHAALDRAGIEIPYPPMVLHRGE